MSATERLLRVAWPGFLVACALEMVVFGLIDPAELHWRGAPIDLPRTAIYSIGFALFWLACSTAGAITLQLSRSADELNRPTESARASLTE